MKKIHTRNFLDQQNLLTSQMKKSSQMFSLNFSDQKSSQTFSLKFSDEKIESNFFI